MSAVILPPNSETRYFTSPTNNYSRQMQMFAQQQQQQQQQQQHHQQQHQQQQQQQHHNHHQSNYLQSNNCKTESLPSLPLSLPEQQPQQPSTMLKNNNNTSQINNNNTPTPHFEYVSYDRVQDLYEQRKGHFYFIPEGFEPVLVPNDSKAQTVTNLLETSKPVSTAPNVSRMLPDTDVRLPSFALPCGVAGPAKKDVAPNGKVPKVKKPPRPPNAFILYRRAKQPVIVAQNQGITNNEVSKEIGKMWHEEPMEIRLKFQKMAEAAKEEHMKKYPEYRYRPRRPQERKRRVQTREASNRRSSAPSLPHRVSSSSIVENPEYLSSRRVSSISSDGENNRSPIQNQQQIYYTNSESQSDSTYGMIDNSNMPPQFTSYMQNDFSVFEAQPQEMSEDGVDFDYDYDYNPQMTLNYAEHYPHQYVQKY